MIIAGELKKDQDVPVTEAQKCFCCGRKVKSATEGVRSGPRVMCDSCYETLLNPFPRHCVAPGC
jgi:hypothetical protein